MLKIYSFLLIGGLFLASGCATLVSQTSYPVRIMSMPDQAFISITNRYGREIFQGQTPATAHLEASAGYFQKATYTVTIWKEGYEARSYLIEAKLNGWYFGNFIIPGGLFGFLVIDPLTGAMFKIDTTLINTELILQSAAMPVSDSLELRVLNINDIPESWKAHLVQLN